MNFAPLDWLIVAGLVSAVVYMTLVSNRYTKSVADFLVAGRATGRYMMTMASGMLWISALNVIAMFELYSSSGFTAMWWVMLTTPFAVYLGITGFGVYRFRETRALTIAQFLEIRYSRTVRIFAAILAWVMGMINFAYFPAVEARFFMHFCGFSESFQCLGMQWQTFPVTMFVLIAGSMFFVFAGGHIAVVLTDCIQGIFVQVAALIVIVGVGITWFQWDKIAEVLLKAPVGQSLVNPLDTGRVTDFNFWFFAIGTIAAWYTVMSNLQGQAYIASSKTAHEYRMAAVLNQWRWLGFLVFFMVLVLCSLMVLHHPAYADMAAGITAKLDGMKFAAGEEALRNQLSVTLVLAKIMPVGIAGLFCAIMIAATITTYDGFLHSWGAVFLQDVVMPMRKKPFGNRQHLWLLRLSILGVAALVFFMACNIKIQQSVLMYFAMVNNLWLGPSGAILLCGLYWRRGTTTAALATLVTGVLAGSGGIAIQIWWPEAYKHLMQWSFFGHKFTLPFNPQVYFMLTIALSIAVYVAVSLLDRTVFNIERMLHRGQYAIEEDQTHVREKTSLVQRLFGITSEFDRTDRFIAYMIVGWFLVWLGIFLVGLTYGFVAQPDAKIWVRFWHVYLWILFFLAVSTCVWLSLGGLRDMSRLFHQLKGQVRDYSDDGMVKRHPKDSEIRGEGAGGSTSPQDGAGKNV